MYPYIHIFGLNIQTYYICAALAGIVGVVYSSLSLKKRNQGMWSFFLPVITAVCAIIGARIFNYIINPDAYSDEFKIWTFSYNKLSLIGGLVLGIVVIVLYCLIRKQNFTSITDALTAPAAVGIIILKIGCFLNGCCFGKPTEGLFGMVFPANETKYDFINSIKFLKAKSPVVHPTQLYEIAGALVAILSAIILVRTFRLKEGSRAAIFAAVFCAARWIILPFRETPYSEEIVSVFYPIVYGVMIVICISWLAILNLHRDSANK